MSFSIFEDIQDYFNALDESMSNGVTTIYSKKEPLIAKLLHSGSFYIPLTVFDSGTNEELPLN